MRMNGRLNYRELMQKWMQYYELSAERSKRMWTSILSHLHTSKLKSTEKGEEINEIHVERIDRKRET